MIDHLVHFLGGLGVDAVAGGKCRDGVRIPAVVEHQDIACVLFIPQVGPAGGRFVHHGGVIDDAGGAKHIRHRVFIGGVVVGVAVDFVDVLEVGDVVKVQLCKHPLRDHLGDHIVRRDDDIVIRRAGFQLGVERLIRIKGGVVDVDAGQLLEGIHHVYAVVRAVGDIFTPVVDVQGDVLAHEAGPVVIIRNGNIFRDLDGPSGKRRKRQTDGKHHRQQ